MRSSPEGLGLVPARGFLEQAMAPRPSFNDGSNLGRFFFCVPRSCYEPIFWIAGFLYIKKRNDCNRKL
jgi:hypothetical protein